MPKIAHIEKIHFYLCHFIGLIHAFDPFPEKCYFYKSNLQLSKENILFILTC